MSDQLQFQKKLAELLETAKSQNMRVTQEEIHRCFAEEDLNEEQMLLVYDYLLSQKVIVAGYLKNDGAAKQPAKDTGAPYPADYTEEEREYLRDYESDLKAMKQETAGERQRVFAAAVQGDALAKSRLIELYLPVVVEIAKQMRRGGFYIGDLVQEGNVSLLLALDMLAGMQEEFMHTPEALEKEADRFVRDEIRQGILAMLEEQEELKRRDHKLEKKVNDLDDALHKAADEKGRAVTLDELAEYVQMSADEVLDIMKLAGEDLYDKYKKEKE